MRLGLWFAACALLGACDGPISDLPLADSSSQGPDFGGAGEACASSNEEQCGGRCVDTSTDPNHCGGCGSVCPTGLCEQGVCTDGEQGTGSDPATEMPEAGVPPDGESGPVDGGGFTDGGAGSFDGDASADGG